MDLYSLATELEELDRQERIKLFEATTMNAISFLPAHLGAVRAKFKDLARKKWKWGLEILEDDNGDKDVRIENELRIIVPKEHWKSFQEMFIGELDNNSYLNLKSLLNEALEDDLKELREELKPTLYEMFGEQLFASLDKIIRVWIGRFGVNKYLTDKSKVIVTYENEGKDIQKLYGKLLRAYGDDKGGLEMLLNDIQSKRPLGAFDVFKRYDFLYGVRISSVLHEVTLIFETMVDMSFMISQSIYVDSDDVLDEIEADITTVKRVENVLYPEGEKFSTGFFGSLKDAVEDVVE